MAKGTAIGAVIRTVFGSAGTAIGGFVGKTVGYMAGSKVGETIVKGVPKIRHGASKVIKEVASGIKNAAIDGIKSFCSGIASLFGF